MRKEQYYSMLPFVHNIYTRLYIDGDMHKQVVLAGLGARNGKQIYYTYLYVPVFTTVLLEIVLPF